MKKILLISILFRVSTAFGQQKVKDGSITTGNNLPNKDSILELESSTKGLLHTRVALVQTINPFPLSVHTAGMMVYNTATLNDFMPGIYYNDVTKWVYVKSIDGNALVQNFPGTTGTLGIPGTAGGPGAEVIIVNNDSGTWIYNPSIGKMM